MQRISTRARVKLIIVLLAVSLAATSLVTSCADSEVPPVVQPASGGSAAAKSASSDGKPAGPTAEQKKAIQRAFTRIGKNQGGVTPTVIWMSQEYFKVKGEDGGKYEPDKYVIFQIALDTHSGSLLDYDVKNLVVLRDGKGAELSMADWAVISEDSHHYSGVARFSRYDGNGNQSIGPENQRFELLINSLAGVEQRSILFDTAEIQAKLQPTK